MSKKVGVAALVFKLFATLFSVLALSLPFWQDVDVNGTTGHHGLYRYEFKTLGVETSGNTIDILVGDDRNSLRAIRALMGFGLGQLVGAVISSVCFLACKGKKIPAIVASVESFISGLVHLISWIIFHVDIKQGGDSSYSAGFVLAILTWLFAWTGSVLKVIAYMKHRQGIKV